MLVLLVGPFGQAAGQASTAADKQATGDRSYRQWLERKLVVVERDGEAVRLEAAPGASIGRYDPRRHEWTSSFVLRPGERFFQRGRHARVEFKLQRLGAEGVIIEARPLVEPGAATDEQSSDTSVFVLPYRERGNSP